MHVFIRYKPGTLHALKLTRDLKLKIDARFMRYKRGILHALKLTHGLKVKVNLRFMCSKQGILHVGISVFEGGVSVIF